MTPRAWTVLLCGLGFMVFSLTEMVIAVWLGASRVDPEGKTDAGLGSSAATFVNRLRPSCYRLEARRWVPLLWSTFTLRVLLLVAAIVAASGA